MNPQLIGRGWDERKALLLGELAEQACLGFQDFGFIAFESFLHVFQPVAQQSVDSAPPARRLYEENCPSR